LTVLLTILFFTLQVNIFAQDYSQLKLLPVPNEKVINFINPDDPVITDLPVHPFDFGGSPGNPHDEDQLLWADLDMEYTGQHPMFAQTLVHDKEGNLLFFIVDNNIYNRFGEKFYKVDFVLKIL